MDCTYSFCLLWLTFDKCLDGPYGKIFRFGTVLSILLAKDFLSKKEGVSKDIEVDLVGTREEDEIKNAFSMNMDILTIFSGSNTVRRTNPENSLQRQSHATIKAHLGLAKEKCA